MGKPVWIGPTGLPERTIFWQAAEWCSRWLQQPDGPDAGGPWVFTDQQAQILAWWFAFDEDGRWLKRRGTIRMMKGWGKRSDRRRPGDDRALRAQPRES